MSGGLLILVGTVLGGLSLVSFGSAVFIAFKTDSAWQTVKVAAAETKPAPVSLVPAATPLYDSTGMPTYPFADAGSYFVDMAGNKYRISLERTTK